MEVTNKFVVIKHHVNGAPQESDFELKTEAFPLSIEIGKKEVIVKNLYLSIDPAQVNRMKSKSSSQQSIKYSGVITPGQAIDGPGVGRVVASGNPDFKKDDLVTGLLSWGEYSRTKEGGLLNKVDTLGFPISYFAGILGYSQRALQRMLDFLRCAIPRKGKKCLSLQLQPSGSVGNLVGQYAKLFGCYVVGSAGSKAKVDLLKEKLGFDEAFNYKEETDLKSAL